MRSPNKILALLTLLTTLTISDFPLIQNPKAKIQNSQVLAQTPDARKAEADRLFQQGSQQYRTSQFEAALQSWQQALIIYREIKDRQSEGEALGNMGIAYANLGDYAKAIEYLQQRLAIAREIKDRQSEARALGNLGGAYYSLGDNAKAIEYSKQQLAIAREIQTRPSEGMALSNLGLLYTDLGDNAKAIEYLQQALIICREIKDRQGEGTTLGNLGNAYLKLGDYAKALEYSKQQLAIAREIKNPQREGTALGNLGNAYLKLGDYAKALECFNPSLAIARAIKNPRSEGKALGNLGVAYDYLGDYAKAIEYHQQFLAIARAIKDRAGEARSLGNLGVVYLYLGDYAKVIDYEQQMLALARNIKNRQNEGKALGNLGVAYNYLGDYARGIEYSKQAMAIAQEIQDQQTKGILLGNLGLTYNYLGDYAKSIDYLQQFLVSARQIQDPDNEGLALNNLGLTLYNKGDLTTAEQTLFEALKVRESIRARVGNNDVNKVSIFETQANTYKILQEVLIAQNKTDSALEIAERGRARAFVELLARRLSPNPTEQPPSTPPTIEQIKQIAQQQNATFVEYSIIYNDFKIKGKQESHESELYIWVIKPTGEVTFRRSDLKPLWQKENTTVAELVTNSRESLGVRNRSEPARVVVEPSPEAQQQREAQQRQKLQQLHQLLIEPIANLLPTDPQARVIFIPQSNLFLVPFPALVDASGQYLIEKHTILTAPSIEVLNLTRQQRQLLKSAISHPAPSDVLIVGNPSMPKVWNPKSGKPEQLPYLEGAEKEAQALSNFFHVPALLDEQATERTIKQRISNARIVHLATHGLLDYGNPQDTGARDFPGAVALAPGDGEDGLLTSAEIQQMKLKAELVVLSACDTGQGRLTGDGVIGLSRSLISAGVPSVIVSLWSVDDAATAELMREFYSQWQHQPDKAQALRQAMLITMKNHPDPILWAAFTLIGESE